MYVILFVQQEQFHQLNQMENRTQGITDLLSRMNDDQLKVVIQRTYDEWTHAPVSTDRIAWAKKRFNIDHLARPCAEDITTAYHQHKRGLNNTIKEAKCRNIMGNGTNESLHVTKLINGINRSLSTCYRLLASDVFIQGGMMDSDPRTDKILGFDFDEGQEEDNVHIKLIDFFVIELYRLGLRRKGDSVYRQVMTQSNVGTHFWEPVCTIHEFIWSVDRHTNFTVWKMLNDKGGREHENVERYLLQDRSGDVLELKPDRYWLSWSNGMYHVESNMFYGYESPDIPVDVVSHRYFKQEFDWETIQACNGNPLNLPTPSFDRVLDTQKLTGQHLFEDDWGFTYYTKNNVTIKRSEKDGVVRFMEDTDAHTLIPDMTLEKLEDEGWKPVTNENPMIMLYAMLGRLLYSLHKDDKTEHLRDNWQKIMFIKGLAGNGKSTIANIAKFWFNKWDVGTLESASSIAFPLENLYDKLVWMCTEVRHNFDLDTGLFQSMVSGENVSVNEKHTKQRDIVWDAPGLLFGNQLPKKWTDGGGSLIRRILMFEFNDTPSTTDPHLYEGIMQEMSILLVKSNMMYKEVIKHLDRTNRSVDEFLSPYFRKTRESLMKEVHLLYRFFTSENVEVGKDFQCPLKEFRRAFNDFCQENNLPRQRWSPDFYALPFRKYKIRQDKGTHKYGERTMYGDWVYGVRIVDQIGIEESILSGVPKRKRQDNNEDIDK